MHTWGLQKENQNEQQPFSPSEGKPKDNKRKKEKKKCGRIPGLAGRTGAVGASMSDLRFDLHIKFFYGVCSQISQCTH